MCVISLPGRLKPNWLQCIVCAFYRYVSGGAKRGICFMFSVLGRAKRATRNYPVATHTVLLLKCVPAILLVFIKKIVAILINSALGFMVTCSFYTFWTDVVTLCGKVLGEYGQHYYHNTEWGWSPRCRCFSVALLSMLFTHTVSIASAADACTNMIAAGVLVQKNNCILKEYQTFLSSVNFKP